MVNLHIFSWKRIIVEYDVEIQRRNKSVKIKSEIGWRQRKNEDLECKKTTKTHHKAIEWFTSKWCASIIDWLVNTELTLE